MLLFIHSSLNASVFFFDHFQSSICSIASVIWLNSTFCITEYDGIQPVLWGNKIENQQILNKIDGKITTDEKSI